MTWQIISDSKSCHHKILTLIHCIQVQRNSDEESSSEPWIRARKATLKNLPKILICLANVFDKVVAEKPLQAQRCKVNNTA